MRCIHPSRLLLQNATLEAEHQGARVQLKQLEGQSDSQQAQILALQRQAASLQESNTALQTHNANLQVRVALGFLPFARHHHVTAGSVKYLCNHFF